MPARPDAAETFEQFLQRKKIDAVRFAATRPADYAHYAAVFVRVGTNSFDHQTKFLLNDWRLDFPVAAAT
jgi:hypothetical protein